MFGSCGKGTKVLGRIKVYSPENICIGNNCTINEGVVLNALGKIKIGDNVHISPFVIINTGFLDLEKWNTNVRVHRSEDVTIENGVWLSSNSIINPGVKIGENSVVGSGAVVTKDIPPNCFSCGVPASIKRKIRSN